MTESRRAERIRWEEDHFAPWAYFSTYADGFDGRPHVEAPDDYRTPFQVDRDRIQTSAFFRQLASKTQVYTYFHSDLFRRRLTHTLEVHRLALTLCEYFYVNDILVSAIALGHDLGHVPFGHGGEHAVDSFMKANHNDNEVHFSHALNSLRVVDFIIDDDVRSVEADGRVNGHFGLNLCHVTRESIAKHTDTEETKTDYFVTHEGRLFPNIPPPIEGQIVQMADMIASFVADFEDAVKCKLLGMNELREDAILMKYLNDHRKRPDPVVLSDDERALRGPLTWALMQDAIDTTRDYLKKLDGNNGERYLAMMSQGERTGFTPDRAMIDDHVRKPSKIGIAERAPYIGRWTNPNIVRFSEAGVEICRRLWRLRSERIWNSSLVTRMNKKASDVIKSLLAMYCETPRLMDHANRPYNERHLPAKYQTFNDTQRKFDYHEAITRPGNHRLDVEIVVIDYLTGLSDQTAIDEYQRLTDPSRRSIVR